MSGVVAKVKSFFSPQAATVANLEEAEREAKVRVDETAVRSAEAQRALAAGEVGAGAGLKAIGAARDAHSRALADLEAAEQAVADAIVLRDEAEKARAEAVEVKRQAAVLAEAEKLDTLFRKKFAEAIGLASELVTVANRITSWRSSRFDTATIMQEEFQRASAGALRVHEIQLPLVAIRIADPPPALVATMAELDRERARRHEILRAPAPRAEQRSPVGSEAHRREAS